MEDLFGDNRLGELEEKIDGLIRTLRGTKDEKEGLSSRVEALETENRELKEQMVKAEQEKDVIMLKVKGILEKIQRIEG